MLPQENANRPCVARVSVSEELHLLLVTTDVLILDVSGHSQPGGENHRAPGDREQKRAEEEKHLNLKKR